MAARPSLRSEITELSFLKLTSDSRTPETPTLPQLVYNQQLDTVLSWTGNWSNEMVGALLDWLLQNSRDSQIQLLWSITQGAAAKQLATEALSRFSKKKQQQANRRRSMHPAAQSRQLDQDDLNYTFPAESVRSKSTSVLYSGRNKDHGGVHEHHLRTLGVMANVRVPQTSAFPNDVRTLVGWYSQWSDIQRNRFLQRILVDVGRPHFERIALKIHRHRSRDEFNSLPASIIGQIFSYLTADQLIVASQVCKSWRSLTLDDHYWRPICVQLQLDRVNVALQVERGPRDFHWYRWYQAAHGARTNWLAPATQTTDLKGHASKVLSIALETRRVATGDMGGTIMVWSIASARCLQKLAGHTAGVWSLCFFNDYLLVSACFDGSIKVWNLKLWKETRHISAHKESVWALALRGVYVLSASQDGTARLWDITRGKLLHTLVGHQHGVYCVALDEEPDTAFTGSADKTIRQWSVAAGECTRVFHPAASSSIMSLSYHAHHLAFSSGVALAVYDLASGRVCTHFNEEHKKRIEAVQLHVGQDDAYVMSAAGDGQLKYWDLSKAKSQRTLKGHGERRVSCVRFDDRRIATAGYDFRVKLWSFD